MNPRLPRGRRVIVVTGFMINPSCPEKDKTEVKKWKPLESLKMYRPWPTAIVDPLARPATPQTRIQVLLIRTWRSTQLTQRIRKRATADPKSQLFFWRKKHGI